MKRLLLALGVAWAATLPGEVRAEKQQWLITGEVASIVNLTTVPGIPFMVGDPFTYRFTIDEGAARTGGGTNTSVFPAVASSRFEIPSRGFAIEWNNGNSVSTANFTNSDAWELTGVAANVTNSIPTLGNGANGPVDFVSFFLSLSPPNGTFPVNPPPLIQPDPTWPLLDYEVNYSDSAGTGLYSLLLTPTTFAQVPEPSSCMMTALTMLALVGFRLRRRRSSWSDEGVMHFRSRLP